MTETPRTEVSYAKACKSPQNLKGGAVEREGRTGGKTEKNSFGKLDTLKSLEENYMRVNVEKKLHRAVAILEAPGKGRKKEVDMKWPHSTEKRERLNALSRGENCPRISRTGALNLKAQNGKYGNITSWE